MPHAQHEKDRAIGRGQPFIGTRMHPAPRPESPDARETRERLDMFVSPLRDFEVEPTALRQAAIVATVLAAAGLGIAFTLAPHFPWK